MSVNHLRRHQNRLNLRPRAQPPLSDEGRALVERIRAQAPQLTPAPGTPSPLLGQPEHYARAESSGSIADE